MAGGVRNLSKVMQCTLEERGPSGKGASPPIKAGRPECNALCLLGTGLGSGILPCSSPASLPYYLPFPYPGLSPTASPHPPCPTRCWSGSASMELHHLLSHSELHPRKKFGDLELAEGTNIRNNRRFQSTMKLWRAFSHFDLYLNIFSRLAL